MGSIDGADRILKLDAALPILWGQVALSTRSTREAG